MLLGGAGSKDRRKLEQGDQRVSYTKLQSLLVHYDKPERMWELVESRGKLRVGAEDISEENKYLNDLASRAGHESSGASEGYSSSTEISNNCNYILSRTLHLSTPFPTRLHEQNGSYPPLYALFLSLERWWAGGTPHDGSAERRTVTLPPSLLV